MTMISEVMGWIDKNCHHNNIYIYLEEDYIGYLWIDDTDLPPLSHQNWHRKKNHELQSKIGLIQLPIFPYSR